jgi:Integrase core domain
MNATCERLVGTLRRDLPDRILILGEAHLSAVLAEYQVHYNTARPHQGTVQRVPDRDHHASSVTPTDLDAHRIREARPGRPDQRIHACPVRPRGSAGHQPNPIFEWDKTRFADRLADGDRSLPAHAWTCVDACEVPNGRRLRRRGGGECSLGPRMPPRLRFALDPRAISGLMTGPWALCGTMIIGGRLEQNFTPAARDHRRRHRRHCAEDLSWRRKTSRHSGKPWPGAETAAQ